ncbi:MULTISPECIES: copper amine oxidase N-terminal domain-containing protein [Paenibacillus]|uniref:Copper amine oxidase N-terminal domain-containing protein n=1 Tax=Paenibacillus radicis (ex Xue et al. 2023) TaxID=2972489 RepID=A0ABT1YK17_9BACL|nr:copper amine oxidase N-terminal domain-containing protein [Paenibacillus radicis (ex Xue et al. 2023)]MCR8633543.1 copper amine oxidase N-terminal domain-containing protein [Paenibacillus radicis (ex Xue et al. 2023)]
MKVPRLLTLVLSLSLFGATGAFASSMWGDYEGFGKVKLLINGVEKQYSDSETPAFLIKGNAIMPVRTLADSLQSLVKWDNGSKTVSVYKPNVHMFVAEKVKDDYSIQTPFGAVVKGTRMDFAVFAQVDSLNTPFHSFKISIESPSGKQSAFKEEIVDGEKENFWYPWPFTGFTFSEAGNYKVKFSIKVDDDGDYTTVSQKVITSK